MWVCLKLMVAEKESFTGNVKINNSFLGYPIFRLRVAFSITMTTSFMTSGSRQQYLNATTFVGSVSGMAFVPLRALQLQVVKTTAMEKKAKHVSCNGYIVHTKSNGL